MSNKKPGNSDEFGGPAIYRMLIRGRLPAEWTDRMAGMVITESIENGTGPATVLEGPIRDPSELAGVMDALHDLHLSILKLEQVEN